MRFAITDEQVSFYFPHPSLVRGLTDLQVEIRTYEGELLETLAAEELSHPELLGVYQAESWTPTVEGSYLLVWSSSVDDLLVTEPLLVGEVFTGDWPASSARVHQRVFDDTGLDCELHIYDADLAVVHSVDLEEDATHSKLYHTPSTLSFTEEGQYLRVWLADGVVVEVESIFFGSSLGMRTVTVLVRRYWDTGDSSLQAAVVADCDVLASLPDGTPVQQTVTDANGKAMLSLEQDVQHIITLQFSGWVFSTNNVEFTPQDPTEYGPRVNEIGLVGRMFYPTFGNRRRVAAANLCLVSVDVVDLTGDPLQGLSVLIDNLYLPSVIAGSVAGEYLGVAGRSVHLKTDARGHAETYLIRGQTVRVSIPGTEIVRMVTVPDEETASIMGLVTGSDDPFEIARPEIPAAEKRS